MAGNTFDLVVIGAGPAGYVAAIRAAQLGMTVALIEKRKTLGGTCLNVGCIPSKALLDSSHRYHSALHDLASHGIEVGKAKLNLKQMMSRKDGVVKQLTGGIEFLMKKNKITVFNGHARITEEKMVQVTGQKQPLQAKHILVATGSVPVELPFARFDGHHILSSTEALELTEVPKRLIVIGAGVIGLEMGSVWNRLGAEVTVIDIAERPLAIMDADLGREAQRIFTKQGLKFVLGAAVEGVKADKSGVAVNLKNAQGKVETLKGDKVLVAVGRRPNTADMGLDEAGVKMDNRGTIQVDKHYATNVPGIYAVGDCIPGPMLAHKGEEEGIACVEMLAGQHGHVNYNAIPWVVYTEPEVAGAGLTEAEAKEQGLAYKVGKFAYKANGRALAMNESDGFVKIIADKQTDRLLGMHIIGAHASDMIMEGVMALEFGASSEDVARTVHAHPTLSEVTKEAALAVAGRVIHG